VYFGVGDLRHLYFWAKIKGGGLRKGKKREKNVQNDKEKTQK